MCTQQQRQPTQPKFPTVANNVFISAAELRQETKNLCEKPTDEEVDKTIRDAVVDGNGRIDLPEFWWRGSWVKRRQERQLV